MIKAKDSVFVGILDHVGFPRVLMVRRRSGEKWWLPGGAIDGPGTECTHAYRWLECLFSTGTIRFSETGIGPWQLSNGSKAFLVDAEIHGLTDLDSIDLHIRDGFENKYITEVAAMSSKDIHHHLYTAQDMPWGQAKMALWSMYSQPLTIMHGHQQGNPLRDDLGYINGRDWRRPS